ncbi:hypothetical protein [Escherichia coli]|uniref:hypothetical protein n=1 Tax=Escherichia coli TaxID=562 RepID=UPI001FCE7527|nr:hypothetical protein [Escherichia coli]
MFSHPVYLFLREFSLQDFRGGSLAEDPETLSISCEVTFRHGTLRFNGNVSEKLLTLLIQELKR